MPTHCFVDANHANFKGDPTVSEGKKEEENIVGGINMWLRIHAMKN